jgi:hypothetical protein
MSQTELDFVNDLALPSDAVSINRRAWFRDLDGVGRNRSPATLRAAIPWR